MTIGNFSEKVGTSRTDRLKAKDLQIAYGLGDDDLLKSARGRLPGGIETTILVGGSGTAKYVAGTNMSTVILATGGSKNDLAIAKGIGLTRDASFALDINGRHLYAGDDNSQQYVLLLDWKKPANRIENFRLADGTFSYKEIVSSYRQTENYLGNFSWSQFATDLRLDVNFSRLGLDPATVEGDIQDVLRRAKRLERSARKTRSRLRNVGHEQDALTGSDDSPIVGGDAIATDQSPQSQTPGQWNISAALDAESADNGANLQELRQALMAELGIGGYSEPFTTPDNPFAGSEPVNSFPEPWAQSPWPSPPQSS